MKKAISFACLLPIITAIGAQLGTWVTPLLVIISVCVVTVLVAKDKIKGKELYLYVYALALSLVWQTTMMGLDVVGSDIHDEIYWARYDLTHSWDITGHSASNTSFVIGALAPFLSKLFHCDIVWIFKIVFPLFLAGVPLILFKMYKGIFGEKRAYYASIFFMIIPVYSMEIAQIAKSMVAELFLTIMFYALVSNWRQWVKGLVIVICLSLAILAHYTVGIIGLCFLLGIFIFRLVTNWWKWRLVQNKKTNLLVLGLSLVICVGVFFAYHGQAANGMAVRSVTEVVVNNLPQQSDTPISEQDNIQEDVLNNKQGNEQESSTQYKVSERIKEAPTLVKLGIGADFMNMPIEGKVFRVVQYLTELLIIIGVLWLIFAYKKHNYPAEYVGFVGVAGVLLIMCIFVPNISVIINMTRFYHYALFALAPMFVVGTEFIAERIGK